MRGDLVEILEEAQYLLAQPLMVNKLPKEELERVGEVISDSRKFLRV